MAVPARGSVTAHDPPAPEREPGPAERGWLDIQQAAATCLAACALAVREMAGRPGDDAAVSMAGLTRACAEKLGDVARDGLEHERGRVLGEAALEAERRQGYDEGYAACKAERRRMGVIGRGRPG